MTEAPKSNRVTLFIDSAAPAAPLAPAQPAPTAPAPPPSPPKSDGLGELVKLSKELGIDWNPIIRDFLAERKERRQQREQPPAAATTATAAPAQPAAPAPAAATAAAPPPASAPAQERPPLTQPQKDLLERIAKMSDDDFNATVLKLVGMVPADVLEEKTGGIISAAKVKALPEGKLAEIVATLLPLASRERALSLAGHMMRGQPDKYARLALLYLNTSGGLSE